MALAEALPPVPSPARPRPLRGVAPAETPWMKTALFGSPEEVASLNPNLATPGGTTVLMMASDQPAKVKALLRTGANAKATAKSGFDALLVAAHYPGNRETLELLVAAGATPAPRPGVKYKSSALPLAVISGDSSMVRFLLDQGGSADLKYGVLGFDPQPIILIAASFEHVEVMRTLAAAGANLEATDPDGMTSVSWSALGHKDRALKALLELGAKRDVKDRFGLTPLEHTKAIAYSSPVAEQLLRSPR
jgi:ankyrin repeat protein